MISYHQLVVLLVDSQISSTLLCSQWSAQSPLFAPVLGYTMETRQNRTSLLKYSKKKLNIHTNRKEIRGNTAQVVTCNSLSCCTLLPYNGHSILIHHKPVGLHNSSGTYANLPTTVSEHQVINTIPFTFIYHLTRHGDLESPPLFLN